jgi:hypothetical protein
MRPSHLRRYGSTAKRRERRQERRALRPRRSESVSGDEERERSRGLLIGGGCAMRVRAHHLLHHWRWLASRLLQKLQQEAQDKGASEGERCGWLSSQRPGVR